MTKEEKLLKEAARAKAEWQAKKAAIRAEKEAARATRDAAIYSDYCVVTASQPELPVMDVYAILCRHHKCCHNVVYLALKRHGVDMTRGRARRERSAR